MNMITDSSLMYFAFLVLVSFRHRPQRRWYLLHYTSKHADKRRRLHVGGHVLMVSFLFMCAAVSFDHRAQYRWYLLHYTPEHTDKRQRLHVGGHVQWTPLCRARQPGTVLHRPRWRPLQSHSQLPPPWQAATDLHGSKCSFSWGGWVLPGDRVSKLVQDISWSSCCRPGF